MHRPADLLKRAKRLYQTDGLKSLISRGSGFFIGLLFEYQRLRLWHYNVEDVRLLNEAEVMPRIRDFTFKIVTTNEEADKLEADGFEFRSYNANARKALENGAIAFCIFTGHELGNIGWLALNPQAKNALRQLPYKVDFSSGEACTIDVWTNPRYRRMGLRSYAHLRRCQFLLQNSVVTLIAAIDKGNTASETAAAKLGLRAYAEGHYLKILWLRSWKEKPLPPQEQEVSAKHDV